jgi:hypothetical protein
MRKTARARPPRAPQETSLEERFHGWHVWTLGRVKVATRTGSPPPRHDDPAWAKTLACDTWEELETELTAQQALTTAQALSGAARN